jgi:hypothetical protein
MSKPGHGRPGPDPRATATLGSRPPSATFIAGLQPAPEARVLGRYVRTRLSVITARYTWRVPDVVSELLVTEAALDKLGARTIAADEAEQLPRNAHLTVRTPATKPPRARGGY